MKKFYKIFFLSLFLLSFLSCQTISTKVDEATKKEEQELSKWIGKTESKLTSSLGKPDRIDFGKTRSRYNKCANEEAETLNHNSKENCNDDVSRSNIDNTRKPATRQHDKPPKRKA